jgi:hypothetical protein
VSLKVYEAGGKAIHVPLPSDHPLVVILKEVLGTGSSSGAAVGGAAGKELAVLRAGAREVADALLTGVLQQQVRASRPPCCVHLAAELCALVVCADICGHGKLRLSSVGLRDFKLLVLLGLIS